MLVTPAELRQALDVPTTSVPDEDLLKICEAVDGAIVPLLTSGVDHSTHANCREAGLGVGVQIFQARVAPGGQMLGLDLAPLSTPHLLGIGLVSRFQGLLAPCMPYGGAVIG